ncbi:hypothetical protein ACFSKY_06420 [Azotobacter chroococcum]|uniref:hypothetical protein n=1 Tax=Azotobacter chroococcum TaxID=353 RepID=UPI001047C269|nr:hypothetical protein [Azotobacter chroococcum]
MAAFRTTEKMKAARKAAMDRLRGMSYSEMLERSLANQDSTTVSFLMACQSEQPFLAESHHAEMVIQEEFTVAGSPVKQGPYYGGSRLSATASQWAQALQGCMLVPRSEDYFAAAA